MTTRATVLLALLIVVGSTPVRSADPLVIEPNGAAVPSAVIAPQATDEVATPGPQPEAGDFVIGKADAPVLVYEYSSFFCTDCRRYRHGQHPRVLKRLVDTGAVRFVHRDMPLSQLAFKAAVLTRCAAPDQRDRMVTELSVFQHAWGGLKDPVRGLSSIALAYGVPRDQVQACLDDDVAIKRVADEFAAGQALFRVTKLPTFFFVKGDAVARLEGVPTLEDFQGVIAALDKASRP